jgi:hypothetical protein
LSGFLSRLSRKFSRLSGFLSRQGIKCIFSLFLGFCVFFSLSPGS